MAKGYDDEATDPRITREQAVVTHFRVIYQAIQRHSAWVEKECGVSSAQLWAMWVLSQQPGLKVSELSAVMAIHPSTASNMLDKLEKKALIQRTRGERDHRVVRLTLTDAGKKLLTRAPQPAQGALVNALSALSENQLAELNRSLSRLTRLLSNGGESANLQPIAGGA